MGPRLATPPPDCSPRSTEAAGAVVEAVFILITAFKVWFKVWLPCGCNVG